MSAPASNPASICIRRRVAWVDTDAAGIYHWMTVARFAEAAEVALHDALGILGETFGSMPRTHIDFDFHRALRFHDEALVTLSVESVGRSSATYHCEVSTPDGTPVATGTVATCLVDGDGRPRPVPTRLRTALTTGGPQSERDSS